MENITDTKTLELIGKNLKYLRKRTFKEIRNKNNKLVLKRLVQKELAKEVLNVTFQQIQKYEKGVNRLCALKLYKLSKFFGIPMEYFFDNQFINRQSYTKVFREQNVQQQHNI